MSEIVKQERNQIKYKWSDIKWELEKGLKTWAVLKKTYPEVQKQQDLYKHTFSRWKDPIYYPKVLQLYGDGLNIIQIMKRLSISNPCNICFVLDYNRRQLREFDLMYMNAYFLADRVEKGTIYYSWGYSEDFDLRKAVANYYWNQISYDHD